MKLFFYTIFSLLLTIIILAFPSECVPLALNGLNLWFERMIPTLFPFMVLSGVIIRMNLTESFVKILNPVLGRLFRVRPACVYGILMGFLCGFPMGAHVAAQLYREKQISRQEASFLLSFCNNIGPVYFLSFVLPALGLAGGGSISAGQSKIGPVFLKLGGYAPFLFGMYGLPFLYGLVLRRTLFKNNGQRAPRAVPMSNQIAPSSGPPGRKRPLSFPTALDDSVFGALSGIARLGGYMIFFNLLFILPILASKLLALDDTLSAFLTGAAACLLEITGGIGRLGSRMPMLVLCTLPFGGLSCIAQTFGMIRDTDLSIREYVMHKMILTALTVLYYLLLSEKLFPR